MVRFSRLLAACVLVSGLSACQANPGPPPVVEADEQSASPTESTTESPTPEEDPEEDVLPERSTVAIGVDPLRGGLNPHLIAHNSELVSPVSYTHLRAHET